MPSGIPIAVTDDLKPEPNAEVVECHLYLVDAETGKRLLVVPHGLKATLDALDARLKETERKLPKE